MEIWAKVIMYTVTKFVVFAHILLEIDFSCYLWTGIDFPLTWRRFLIIPEFLLEVCASRYRKNRFLGFCTFIFLKYREVCNHQSYTSPTLGLLSSGFQMIFRAHIVPGHNDAMGCICLCIFYGLVITWNCYLFSWFGSYGLQYGRCRQSAYIMWW